GFADSAPGPLDGRPDPRGKQDRLSHARTFLQQSRCRRPLRRRPFLSTSCARLSPRIAMTRFGTVVLLVLLAQAVNAGDWPQWLGPKRNGGASDKVAAWKKGEAPRPLWKKAVGNGYSSPVVAGGKVFLHTRGGDPEKQEEQVTAFDALSGKELWKE